MRPVDKWPVGQTNPPNGVTILTQYNPHGSANPLLQENLDSFCSYYEIFSSDLEVEHIISINQESARKTEWDNFLLACGRCNGKDNKSNKPVDLT
ncbi:MAG: HNH endonuclease [Saprospiraceae bacterium]